MERFAVDTLCVTRGAEGALLWHEGERYAHPGYQANVVDTVGSGDAFLAMLLTQLLAGAPGAEALDWANRLGAYVAGQPGATPVYSRRDLFDLPAKLAMLSPTRSPLLGDLPCVRSIERVPCSDES